MKINKSELGRQYGVDRRTIDRYLNGKGKSKTRNRNSKIDDFYDVIKELLSLETKQLFHYKQNLWQRLKIHHELECSQSTFRSYISKNPEFQVYFDERKRSEAAHYENRFRNKER